MEYRQHIVNMQNLGASPPLYSRWRRGHHFPPGPISHRVMAEVKWASLRVLKCFKSDCSGKRPWLSRWHFEISISEKICGKTYRRGGDPKSTDKPGINDCRLFAFDALEWRVSSQPFRILIDGDLSNKLHHHLVREFAPEN
jgi:hypothetical protein